MSASKLLDRVPMIFGIFMVIFYVAFGIFLLIDGNVFYWVSKPKLHLLAVIVFCYALFKSYRLYRKMKEELRDENE